MYLLTTYIVLFFRLYFDKTEEVKDCMTELFHNELKMLDFRKHRCVGDKVVNDCVGL